MTEWRVVPSNPKYLASSDGQIRHIESPKSRKLQRTPRGYYLVNMWQDRKLRVRSVHSLVAEAFIGPRPYEGAEVRHLDGNPSNNTSTNLFYGTAKENAADRELHGRTKRGQRNGNSKLPDDEVDFIRIGYAANLFDQRQLAALFRISQAQVNNILLKKQRVRRAA